MLFLREGDICNKYHNRYPIVEHVGILLLTFVSFFSYGTSYNYNILVKQFGGSKNLPSHKNKFNPMPVKSSAQDSTFSKYSELEDTVTRAFYFFCRLNIRCSFMNKASAIPSGAFVAYEILPISVRERYHDVKACMFCSCRSRFAET